MMIVVSFFAMSGFFSDVLGFPHDSVLLGATPNKITLNPETETVYVSTDEGEILVIDSSSNQIIAKFTLFEKLNMQKSQILSKETIKSIESSSTRSSISGIYVNQDNTDIGSLPLLYAFPDKLAIDLDKNEIYILCICVFGTSITDSVAKYPIVKLNAETFEFLQWVSDIEEDTLYDRFVLMNTSLYGSMSDLKNDLILEFRTTADEDPAREKKLYTAMLNENLDEVGRIPYWPDYWNGLEYDIDNKIAFNVINYPNPIDNSTSAERIKQRTPFLEPNFFLDPSGYFVASNLKTNEYRVIPVGNEPGGMAFDPSKNFVYVINQGHNSISIIDIETLSLISTPATFRLEIGLIVFIGFGVAMSLVHIKTKRVSKRFTAGLVLCAGGIFLNWSQHLVAPYLSPSSFNVLNVGLIVFFLVSLAYSIMFISFLLIRYERYRKTSWNILYTYPKTKLIQSVIFSIDSPKPIIQFIIIGMIITGITIFVAATVQLKDLIEIVPGLQEFSNIIGSSELLEELEKNDGSAGSAGESKSTPALTTLLEMLGVFLYIFLGIGSFWLFVLRQLWKVQSRRDSPKFTGSRALLIFLYFGFALFVIKTITGWDFQDQEDLYEGLILGILVIFLFSALSSGIAYAVERFLILKLWPVDFKKSDFEQSLREKGG